MADPLDLDARRRLWRIVCARPGLYLRELQRASGLAMGALEYHLGRLEKAALVKVLDDGHKRFFPREMAPADRQVMAFLRQEVPRRILLAAMADDGVAVADLAGRLHVARSTIHYHTGRLRGLDLVEQHGHRLRVLDAARIERLLVTYHATFMDRMVDAFLGGMDALRPG